ncbi:MAG TPA: CehA/McbA family metallohydrolase [Candidatus Dormibacteraeota bacterium]
MQRNTDSSGFADLHVHTDFSDGRDTPAQVIEHARRLEWLDVIAITDHDEIRGAEEALERAANLDRPEVIVGEEVSSLEGHILALFITRLVPRGLPAAETIAAIHEQGGIAIAAHPFWRSAPRAGFRYSVGELATKLPFDGVEVINGGFTPSMLVANQRAGSLPRGQRIAATGGSDAHVREAIGWARTGFPGSSAADLRWSLVEGTTSASSGPIALTGIARYASWGLGRRRPVAPVYS